MIQVLWLFVLLWSALVLAHVCFMEMSYADNLFVRLPGLILSGLLFVAALSGEATKVTIKNSGAEILQVYWIDYKGKRVPYGTIMPG
jgi:hypothetical protein